MVVGRYTSVEICAGLGGQALGLEEAGFDPVLLLDNREDACKTIRLNRRWDVRCLDVRSLAATLTELGKASEVDLLSGGLPRIKSAAQVARRDDDEERQVLRSAIRLVIAIKPRMVLLENLDALVNNEKFTADRAWMERELVAAGYRTHWNVLDAADFGVPQSRRSGFLVGLSDRVSGSFRWPRPLDKPAPTVGEVLLESMESRGWPGAKRWAEEKANRPGPALVGGSDRRGGADLGPSGSKRAWLGVGIDGSSLSNDVPDDSFPENGLPKITVRQAAMLQRIPDDWMIFGGKTAVYRQIGHATPPPLAKAVGIALATALAG